MSCEAGGVFNHDGCPAIAMADLVEFIVERLAPEGSPGAEKRETVAGIVERVLKLELEYLKQCGIAEVADDAALSKPYRIGPQP